MSAAVLPPSAADRAIKRERVLAILNDRGAESIVLRSHTALAWYLDGARTHVSFAGDPIVAVIISRDGDELRVFDNEADRMLAEELGDTASFNVFRVPWHEPLVPANPDSVAPDSVSADSVSAASAPALEEHDVAAELRAARAILLPAELARYRQLCREVAEVLTDAATQASMHESEFEVAARLSGGLAARGIDPLVTLVAGRSRLAQRHPLPTSAAIGDRAMIVVCGRRHGLIANATRWFGWGFSPDEAEASRRILHVEAAFFDATLAGGSLGEAFERGIAGYADAGFDSQEWRNHHQGGAAGYAGRDPRAVPKIGDAIGQGQAFAWNPSAPGAKVEDTVLWGPEGIEVLTADPRWPTVHVAGRDRPAELDRTAPR